LILSEVIQFESCSAHLRIPRDGDFWIKKNKLTGGGAQSPARKSPEGQVGEEGCLGARAQERGVICPARRDRIMLRFKGGYGV
jgi:hypothetical protein